MLVNDEGPKSTMVEDFAVLGLDLPGMPGAPGRRALQEAAGQDDYGATKASMSPEDTDEKAQGGEDEAPAAAPKPAPDKAPAGKDMGATNPFLKPSKPKAAVAAAPADDDDDSDNDKMKDAVESILSLTADEVDALDEDALDGVYEILTGLESMTEDESPKFEAALTVLDAFYGQLQEDEGQSLDREALVGVVEAMEHILEDLGILNDTPTHLGKRIVQYESRHKAKGLAIPTGALQKAGKVHEIKARLENAAHFQKGLANCGAPTAQVGRAHPNGAYEQDNSTSTLVQNLAALRDAVTEGSEIQAAAEEMAEGFQSISATATAWYESIAAEVKTGLSEGTVAEDDARIAIGRHLEGIAYDAEAHLAALSEDACDLNNVAANLESIAADLNDVAEVMKSVE